MKGHRCLYVFIGLVFLSALVTLGEVAPTSLNMVPQTLTKTPPEVVLKLIGTPVEVSSWEVAMSWDAIPHGEDFNLTNDVKPPCVSIREGNKNSKEVWYGDRFLLTVPPVGTTRVFFDGKVLVGGIVAIGSTPTGDLQVRCIYAPKTNTVTVPIGESFGQLVYSPDGSSFDLEISNEKGACVAYEFSVDSFRPTGVLSYVVSIEYPQEGIIRQASLFEAPSGGIFNGHWIAWYPCKDISAQSMTSLLTDVGLAYKNAAWDSNMPEPPQTLHISIFSSWTDASVSAGGLPDGLVRFRPGSGATGWCAESMYDTTISGTYMLVTGLTRTYGGQTGVELLGFFNSYSQNQVWWYRPLQRETISLSPGNVVLYRGDTAAVGLTFVDGDFVVTCLGEPR